MIVKKKEDYKATYNIDDSFTGIYGMSTLYNDTHGCNFAFWVDEHGSGRNVGHNCARYKFKRNGVEIDVLLPFDTCEPKFASTVGNDIIRKFGETTTVFNFLKKFSIPLEMQWNRAITIGTLISIIYEVCIKKKNIYEALDKELYWNLYEIIHIYLCCIQKINDEWRNIVTIANYYRQLESTEYGPQMIDVAKRFIKESYQLDTNSIAEDYNEIKTCLENYKIYCEYVKPIK